MSTDARAPAQRRPAGTAPSRCTTALAAWVLCLCAAAGCGMDWRTDLWFQQAPQARVTPRPEPEGSVPLFARPHLEDRDEGDALRPPFPPGEAAVERGRATFLDRCACCHGREGHGGGPVSRFFPPAPDLAYASVRARSDGFLYATVLLGGRAMPRVSEGLDEQDRWDLVHYVRYIQAQGMAPVAPSAPPSPAPAAPPFAPEHR